MGNRKIVGAVTLALSAVAGSACAQYDGLYVGGGVGMYKGSVEFNPGAFTAGDTKHRSGVNLNIGYGHTFDKFNLAGELSYTNTIGRVSPGAGFTAKLDDAWAWSILPGYKLSNSALLYGRLGMASAKTSGNALLPDSGKTHRGALYGVGVKLAMDKNWSGVVEYQSYDLKSKDYPIGGGSAKPSASGIVLGAQYAF